MLTNLIESLRRTSLGNFIERNYVLAIGAGILVALSLNNWIFLNTGMWVAVPAAAGLAMACALLVRHFACKRSTDAYIYSGRFKTDFDALDPEVKVWITKLELWVLFIGACIVASRLAG